MERYIGTKIINAKPMIRDDYNTLRNWTTPQDENGTDEGYLVEYTDGGKPNVEGYAGYVSWSPKRQFEQAYQTTTGINFGLAIEALKKGLKVTREGWNGKGMFLVYVPGTLNCKFTPNSPYNKAGIESGNINAHIDMYTTQGDFQPAWLASQTDMLTDDWQIME